MSLKRLATSNSKGGHLEESVTFSIFNPLFTSDERWMRVGRCYGSIDFFHLLNSKNLGSNWLSLMRSKAELVSLILDSSLPFYPFFSLHLQPRARRPRNEQGEEGGETAAESATEGAAGATGETKSAKKRNKKAAAKKEVAEAADGALAAEVEGKAKKPITKRQPRPKVAPTGEPSKTTLFVSNLSWSIDDEKLKTIFGSYKVKTATVIRHKYGNQRSKGFGFVDFESEEEQQKALNNEQGKTHDEREIHMRGEFLRAG